ncbi:MAG: glycosidase [Bacilli bacterium]
MLFKRFEKNPILQPVKESDWESLSVCNPAAWYENGIFYLLYRGAGNDEGHKIQIGLATSKDGFHFERCSQNPVLIPTKDNNDEGCCEDPRVVKMGNLFYVTYAYRAFMPGRYWEGKPFVKPDFPLEEDLPNGLKWNLTNTALAVTKDFIHYKKLGRITDYNTDNRDVILFPRKINGKYYRLERPMEWVGKEYGCNVPSIWINSSDNLLEWPKPKLLATPMEPWEKKKMGGSTPPLETKEGWLTIYHGVSETDGWYRVGIMLLDLNDPSKIIARTKNFVMEPLMPYETEGFYNGCIFPTGNVIVGDTLYMYYGGADRFVNVATASVSAILDYLKNKK